MKQLIATGGLLLASAAIAQLQPAPTPSPGIRLFAEPVQGQLIPGVAPEGTVELALDGKKVALAADRNFIIGLDRDQGPSAVLEARLADGTVARHELRVAPRKWQIEHINIARGTSPADPEYARKRAAERARIDAARARDSGSLGWRQRFIWPSRGRISGRFGSQRIYRGEPAAFHSGTDIAPGAGAPVVAPADGTVVLAGPPIFSLEGNLVIIDHGMGLNSAFLHLATYAVQEGQRVKQGERIGTVGSTGRATGPHLHWSVKWGEARLDPELLVAD